MAHMVDQHKAGERIDLYLKETLGVSRKKAKVLLDAGKVLVNGNKVVIASWSIKAGDKVSILSDTDKDPTENKGHFLKVIFEDADLLIVEKEAGISCEHSPVAWKPSMVSIVNQYLKKTHPHLPVHYVGLVHRLDTDTSGLLLYSKSKEGNKISDQFKRRVIKRRYLAVVDGAVSRQSGKLENYIAPAELGGGQKMRIVGPGKGKKAITQYTVLERYSRATLLEVMIKTGRTHQIRVQLAEAGHPIIGDKIYGTKGKIPFKRQALHACELEFQHPVTAEKVKVSIPLPRDLRRLVDRFRTNS